MASSGKPIAEYLQATDSGTTQCLWCGSEVAPAGARWKDHASQRHSRISRTYPHCYDDETILLFEYFCFNCGTLLDCEVGREGDSPLHDEIQGWAS